MQEENVKKREWVKGAAIIFLSILLVLTFFSNTIMNLSLPEVATVMAASGQINNKVRVQGTVETKESYDVVADQTRTVESVLVRVGDEVNVGDVLVKLSKGDSTELQSLRMQLKELQISYEEQKLNGTDTDYEKEQKEIAKAKAALDKAFSTLATCKDVSASELSAAKLAVVDAQKAVDEAQSAMDEAQIGIENTSEGTAKESVDGSYQQAINDAKAELSSAQAKYQSAKLSYGKTYDVLVEKTKDIIKADIVANSTKPIEKEDIKDSQVAEYLDYYLELATSSLNGTATSDEKTAYNAIHSATLEVESAQKSLDAANQALKDAQARANASYVPAKTYNGKTRSYYENAYSTALAKHTNANKTLTEKKNALSDLEDKQLAYENAMANFESCQENYDVLVDNLSEQMKSDGISVQRDKLALEKIQNEINEVKEQISKLSSTSGTDLKAKVSGTVQSVYVSAGHTFSQGDILMNIEVGDVGFSMTANVSLDEAKLLKEGDAASVSNYWYGTEAIATISTIKPNPQNPRGEKIVNFDITGDAYAGMSISFSIGGKTAYYDTIIPLSALRSDSNGQFVYVVTVKSSPLGNRYTAKRADVKVLAQDDNSAAVSGLSYGDYVVTTSGKPIESGSLVKLVDE